MLFLSRDRQVPRSDNYPQEAHRQPIQYRPDSARSFLSEKSSASVTAARTAIQPASRDSAIFPLKSRAAGRGKTAKYISPSREAPPAM
jgi:hypothetical protein